MPFPLMVEVGPDTFHKPVSYRSRLFLCPTGSEQGQAVKMNRLQGTTAPLTEPWPRHPALMLRRIRRSGWVYSA